MRYIKRLKILLHSNVFFLLLAGVAILYALICQFICPTPRVEEGPMQFSGILTNIQQKGDRYQLEIVGQEKLLVTYFCKDFPFHLGDKVFVEGKVSLPRNSALFDYATYLKAKDIYRLLYADNMVLEKKNQNLFYHIKDFISIKIMNSRVKEYMRAFVMGDASSIDDEVRSSFQSNGINHLFAVSGMHVSLFAGLLFWIFQKLRLKEIIAYGLVLLFLAFYLFLVNYTPSAMRSIWFFFLMACNKEFSLKFTTVQLMLFTLFLLLMMHPFYLFHAGFQFSYGISLGLILFGEKAQKGILGVLKTSFLSFLLGLPILLFHYYECNVLSILWNLFFVPFVSYLIFPMALLSFFLPIVEIPLSFCISFLEMLSSFCQTVSFGTFSFMRLSWIVYVFYGILIFRFLFAMKHRKWSVVYILLPVFLGFHFCYPYFDSSSFLVMIDVGQGDCILLKSPYQKGNILIDTGGKATGNSTLTSRTIVPMLKFFGIKQLDSLILSHGDYDHMGEADKLVEAFPVNSVVLNCGPYNDLEQSFIKLLDQKNIKYNSCIDELIIGQYQFRFLTTKEYDNENDNSNVIYLNYYHYKFLFMGDAGIEKERDIIDQYNLKDIDFLKVGHHGANTSSSKPFIDRMNPKYSFISVGKNNRYGHPKASVLNILKNSTIYRTDIDGSVMLKMLNDRLEVKVIRQL